MRVAYLKKVFISPLDSRLGWDDINPMTDNVKDAHQAFRLVTEWERYRHNDVPGLFPGLIKQYGVENHTPRR